MNLENLTENLIKANELQTRLNALKDLRRKVENSTYVKYYGKSLGCSEIDVVSFVIDVTENRRAAKTLIIDELNKEIEGIEKEIQGFQL
jgi:hydroxypyruvate isomerase